MPETDGLHIVKLLMALISTFCVNCDDDAVKTETLTFVPSLKPNDRESVSLTP